MNNDNLKTTIGLEIHVQLKTKSKMFCGCDNNAEGKEPNTLICPVCLGLPGALPVMNKEAVVATIKTGLALNCEIPKIAKFDRKHYFYPDLPKGYQISQYDEPFAINGSLKIKSQNEKGESEEKKIRITRVHLEEDAGKLIHKNGKSMVDLNRAGTPLMEIVTEPDITSPKQAGEFLRKLQKIVRDEVSVSEASMEKGHLRCDANISITQKSKVKSQNRMSQIIELKNINSFRFIEKALALAEEKLKKEVDRWPEKLTKETWGYDSKKNQIYVQRQKEEAADYRYFPEPDLPPVKSSDFDLSRLKSERHLSEKERLESLISMGIKDKDAQVLLSNSEKELAFRKLSEFTDKNELTAKFIVHNYFGFNLDQEELLKSNQYAKLIDYFSEGKITKSTVPLIAQEIKHGKQAEELLKKYFAGEYDYEKIIEEVKLENKEEVISYQSGKKQLFGFFMGEAMKKMPGANAAEVSNILRKKLDS